MYTLITAAGIGFRSAKTKLYSMLKKENGEVNIIAIIVVLVIALALAMVFRSQIQQLFNKLWDSIFKNAGDVESAFSDTSR
jgi:hypothetical protein